MLGFDAIAESPISETEDLVTAESVASGFALDPRRRVFTMSDRARAFRLEGRGRVFGRNDMARCCVFGGAFCKTSGEAEFVYFDFTNRLASRTIEDVGEPVVSPSGLSADNAQVLDEDVELEDGTILEAGKAVAVLIGGGTAGTTYAVTVTVTLSDSAVLEQEGRVSIEATG